MADADDDLLYGDLYGGADDPISGLAEPEPTPAPAPSTSKPTPPAAAPAVVKPVSPPKFTPAPSQTAPAPAPYLAPPQPQTFPYSNAYTQPPPQTQPIQTAESSNRSSAQSALKNDENNEGKIFVGGLSWETTDENLIEYFGQYGKVSGGNVMRDPATGQSRGFAFLTFEDPLVVNSVLLKEHVLDGKIIDPKRAVPRRDDMLTEKLFVKNVPAGINQEGFRSFFAQFGAVHDSTLMMDRATGIHRGFGFVTYSEPSTVDTVLSNGPHVMNGQTLEIKKSTPRARRDGRDAPVALGPEWQPNQQRYNNGPNQMQVPNQMQAGFDPYAMAAFFKNVSGGQGMWQGWNPMMMMHAMQNGGTMGGGGMGRSGGNLPPRSAPPENAPKGPAAMRNESTGPNRSSRGGRGGYHPYSR